jgi:hypothetical protein
MIVCTACQKALAGGTDTFGDVDCPFCWECYGALNGEGGIGPEGGDYYGLAPHHHDLTITGSIIGSTVLDPLPEPNANGEYIIGNQVFIPTEPGMGIWSYRPLPGWR